MRVAYVSHLGHKFTRIGWGEGEGEEVVHTAEKGINTFTYFTTLDVVDESVDAKCGGHDGDICGIKSCHISRPCSLFSGEFSFYERQFRVYES